ncbi:putative actin-related protein 2/3 complex subunit 1A [Aspergillus sclerotioniger CBS 115572]|uniref:Arp2/3 complex 41 kDa subunit n=1 Tax=Aspergillus sclerotioniger CBS 115572 TaxID=1450535 RepID=A0A317VWR2_9EURO|nr:putative actin-related protein 2/3 complex subunit 1A [Aspergillus sclerotioniger CBS 115572]PWY76360.1 putative actin-related protein 2/3 complex subunit 1A [Aspergillus sclerotioniger CBS 115572]
MATPDAHHLFHNPIADHSFSSDKSTLAVARDSNVELYQKSDNKFSLTDELKGHEKTVTGVDIAPNSGRIVTCSQDRNAYVWERTASGWKPTLVLLRINRAATFVRWSPSEQKFAVGSGARVIAVCYFEEENDWWISKHLKKPIRSTITTLAWHPNSVLLAAGSTDSHARVLSSFIKGVDTRPEPSAWGERLPFNTICGEYLNDSAGWIQGLSFSPSGDALAFTGHDSSVTVVYPSAPDQPPRAMLNIATRLLPFNSLIWNGENEIIAAGHDCEPYRLRGNESGWQLTGTIESKEGPGAGSAREESALHMFRQMDLKGQTQADTQLKTTHQNTISTVRVYEEANGVVCQFSNTVKDNEKDLSAMIAFYAACFLSPFILTCFSLIFPVRAFVRHEADRILPIQILRPVPQGLYDSLEELARVVDVSYCVGSTGLQKPFECLSHCGDLRGFELLTTWNTGPFLSDSCGYIALSHPPSPNRIIVAFRGTYSIANTIVDLSAYPQTYVPYKTGTENGGEGPRCHNCTVHAGFMTSWLNTRSIILDHVAAAREQYTDYELVLVGHSLGGAVAALAGIEMQLRGWEPTVTTFGEPKVGNKGFAEFLTRLFRLEGAAGDVSGQKWQFRRVTHARDPIPLLPMEEWGYVMHAGEIFISKEDLPPSVDDVHFCEGPNDERCISGAEGERALAIALYETVSLATHAKARADRTHADRTCANPTKQQALSSGHQQPLHIQDADAQHRGLFGLPWHLIPTKYRLWELFFSHRDYFWRVGLCIPGGDQTGKGW